VAKMAGKACTTHHYHLQFTPMVMVMVLLDTAIIPSTTI